MTSHYTHRSLHHFNPRSSERLLCIVGSDEHINPQLSEVERISKSRVFSPKWDIYVIPRGGLNEKWPPKAEVF